MPGRTIGSFFGSWSNYVNVRADILLRAHVGAVESRCSCWEMYNLFYFYCEDYFFHVGVCFFLFSFTVSGWGHGFTQGG